MKSFVSPDARPSTLQSLISSVSKIFKDDLGRNKKPVCFQKASIDTKIKKVPTSSLAKWVLMTWNKTLGTRACPLVSYLFHPRCIWGQRGANLDTDD